MLGEKLKKIRQEAKLTQKELAKRVGVSSSTVGMYEQNRRHPSGDVLLKLCGIFNVSLDYLMLDDNDIMHPNSYYNKNTDDLGQIISDLRSQLMTQSGLMFNGQLLDDNDIELIFDAMQIGAGIAFSKSGKKANKEQKNGE